MEVSSSFSYYVRQQQQVQQQRHQNQNLRRTFLAIVISTQRNANSKKKKKKMKLRFISSSSRQVVAAVAVAAAASSDKEIEIEMGSSSSAAASCELQLVPEQAGGKMVVAIVDAFNQLIPKLDRSRSNSELLFKALKLAIPILRTLPHDEQTGRSPLSVSLSVATIVANLQMGDAHLISAALLFHLFTARLISISSVRHHLGSPVAMLLHQSLRLSKLDQMIDHHHHNNISNSSSSSSLINFFLTYYDAPALILHLSLQLDTMRHLHAFPRFQQQSISLQALNIHVPLAHAIGTRTLSLELEDLSFRFLFPFSYFYLDTWLRSHHTGAAIDFYKDQLSLSLNTDPLLSQMLDNISVNGRYKTRYSTMKKLLRDGRPPQQVHDVLGLRVILSPISSDLGDKACYRTRDIITSLWKEMPHRTKDYISHPKPNGYKSLHMAVDVSDNARSMMPLMEIQIRTLEMDMLAAAGSASHSLYKGGLTDPEEAIRLKAIMMAAAEVAALRLQDFPSNQMSNPRDEVFSLLDKNGDGRISIGELMEVMEELGAPGDDAREMMKLLDSNSDGSLSSEEFGQFQKQVEFMRKLEDRDDEYKSMLDEKLHLADNSGLIQM